MLYANTAVSPQWLRRYDSLGQLDPPDACIRPRDVPEGTARVDDPLFVELTKVYLPPC